MKIFSAQVEEGKEGKDGTLSVGPVYRNLLSQNEFRPPDSDINSAWDLFSESVKKYPGNKMLGWRKFVDGSWGLMYGKLTRKFEEVLQIGSALRASGAEPGCRVGIYGSNCPQWIVAMELGLRASYDTLGAGAVNFIIDHAEVDFVFIQEKKVKQLLHPDSRSASRLKAIVCFTSFTEEEKDKAAQIQIKPYSWEEFLHLGKENPSEILPPQPFNICTVMYTSGTSGDPKGVVLTHETIAIFVRGVDLFMEQFEDKMTADDVYYLSFPLRIYLTAWLRNTFSGSKLAWLNRGYKQKYASPLADLLAFRKVKARLGGRLRLIVSGGAPLSAEVEEFLRVTTCAFVLQGYGLTETCGPITIAFPDEMCMLGTVGPIGLYNELRLEEVPELGYNPLGNPSCGEICVRGKTLFSGYYKNPELTRESIKDGWFHTGDIGEILPNGVLKIIDRRKNLIKLSQGEYIAIEYLENVYGITPIVEDVNTLPVSTS
ncbi:hypothetical protein GH714_004770 [Hevea brasiliensis]|uniref:AMP-dependent synthetase/ligase domain-containing protein n=1 Tax=Hevea brasiliensis TaxID=3981 RepID=A0A6A6MA28_HEVBR|nr:hypothetical protein GH714_004770 [Hevea brasiliensis]